MAYSIKLQPLSTSKFKICYTFLGFVSSINSQFLIHSRGQVLLSHNSWITQVRCTIDNCVVGQIVHFSLVLCCWADYKLDVWFRFMRSHFKSAIVWAVQSEVYLRYHSPNRRLAIVWLARVLFLCLNFDL